MNNKVFGETVECLFDYEAMKRGLTVSEPRGESAAYDRIVDNGKRMLRIQVKATGYKMKGAYMLRLRKPCAKKYGDTIDYFAVYCEPDQLWYIIPSKAVRSNSIRFGKAKSIYINDWRALQ